MSIKSTRSVTAVLVSLFVLSLILTVVAAVPSVEAQVGDIGEAASCSQGQTRWVSAGCCPCNVLKKKLQACNSSGQWVDTGYTDCFWGQCCAYPCCV